MRLKKPVRAALNQVRIIREGGTAVVEHADTTISTPNLTIGDGIKEMTDIEILNVYNSVIEVQEQSLRDWDNTISINGPRKNTIRPTGALDSLQGNSASNISCAAPESTEPPSSRSDTAACGHYYYRKKLLPF